ncbi:hypothetical protein [Nonomuraea gerenzanensis]|uniref:WXG100 family type VII secretion target n=1 Tax=Nonomuraea gerenzanensis TaxID=93944 RepID=A0A1M4ED43_9ACTN|nr:hypothetical protein [Nonomuraea gerenzanensis]UBU08388.1 hypothetical protein LCN96_28760 [Nonomuraea gerenzanensis]SBO96730.1 hypothetical protein BN4615_P6246 [Nonomuraea gerenzanensis]
MEIHKRHLRSAATAFETEQSDLRAFVAAAAEDLNAIGDFWGGTQEGVTFMKGQGGGSGYEAVTGQLIEGVEVLLHAHHEIARRLRLMADNVQVADWAGLAAILSELPPADPGRPIWGTG